MSKRKRDCSAEKEVSSFINDKKQRAGKEKDALQKEAIRRAVEGRENLFITGCGGVGKSYVIRAIHNKLTEKGVKVRVTAITGIAACPLRGVTFHHWMRLGIASEDIESLIKKASKSWSKGNWIETDTLIVDEVSMMLPYLFNVLDKVARAVRPSQRNEPFGGIQVILVGDFAQLPPVYQSEEDKWKGLTFAFEHPKWKTYFGKQRTIYLQENFRQEDPILHAQMAKLRYGRLKKEDVKYWSQRIQKVPPELESKVTKLFPTNDEADKVNSKKFKECCPDEKKWVTFDAISKDYGNRGRDPLVAKFLENMEKQCLARCETVLAVGARVMLVTNMDSSRGLVNGTCGTIVGWSEPQVAKHFPGPRRYPLVEFEFEHGKTERVQVLPHSWDYKVQNKTMASYIQIPLRWSWALTIHKSQGMTLPLVAIDLRRIFEYGQAYTAFSRVKTFEGLFLTKFQEDDICMHPLVRKFYNELLSSN